MSQEINTKEMKDSLAKLSKYISTKNSLSILSNFAIKDGYLYITDNKITVQVNMNIKAVDQVFPLAIFKKIVDCLKTEFFTLLDNSTIMSGTRKIKLKSVSIEKFPLQPIFESAYSVLITIKEMKLLLNTRSESDNRRFISGMSLKLNKTNNLQLCSTDGKQLTVIKKTDYNCNFDSATSADAIKQEVIIDTSFLKETNIKSDMIISIGNNLKYSTIQMDNLIITSGLIDGTFPPYEKVIPDLEDYKTTIEIDRKLLVEELTFLKKITDKDFKKTEIGYNNLNSISLKVEDVCVSNTVIEIKSSNKNESDYNSLYIDRELLLNASRLLTEKKILLNIKDPQSTVLIREDNITYIMMLMHS